jgi:hypothetical protein
MQYKITLIRSVFELLGGFPTANASMKNRFQKAHASLASDSPWREKKHVEAFEEWTKGLTYFISHLILGNIYNATHIWEEILVEHPGDLLAAKFAHDTYFYLGDSNNIRDSIARIHPIWRDQFSNHKAYGHVLSMYSFGLEETSLYDKAESLAKKVHFSLPISPIGPRNQRRRCLGSSHCNACQRNARTAKRRNRLDY